MGMNECMAELFGKATGCSKGKGGSMHFFAPDKNFWGGHGIVAGQTPLGLGLAYGLKYQGRKGCCLCFLGDGAVNQGAFHESLNLAALFDLPVVYVIENNGYSMGTCQKRSSAFREHASPSAPKPTAWSGTWSTARTSTRSAPRPRSPWSAPARSPARPCSRSTPTATTATPSPTPTHKKYRTPEEIERYKQNTTRSTSGRTS